MNVDNRAGHILGNWGLSGFWMQPCYSADPGKLSEQGKEF